jgi:hypothetical protein
LSGGHNRRISTEDELASFIIDLADSCSALHPGRDVVHRNMNFNLMGWRLTRQDRAEGAIEAMP